MRSRGWVEVDRCEDHDDDGDLIAEVLPPAMNPFQPPSHHSLDPLLFALTGREAMGKLGTDPNRCAASKSEGAIENARAGRKGGEPEPQEKESSERRASRRNRQTMMGNFAKRNKPLDAPQSPPPPRRP